MIKNSTFIVTVVFLAVISVIFTEQAYAISDNRIQPGHTINITVSGHPELSASRVIRQDGTIEYPLLVGIPLTGLRAEDVRELLLPILIRFSTEPEVFVIVSEDRIIQFEVKGEVARPDRYFEVAPIDLQQAITIAGGMLIDANMRNVQLFRASGDRRERQEIDILALYRSDSLQFAPLLENNDIVVVLRQNANHFVRVVGAVRNPGTFIPNPYSTVIDIIDMAGGLESHADDEKIILIERRNGSSSHRLLDLRNVFKEDRDADIPIVMPGDVIVVETKEFWRRWDWWIETIRDATFVITFYFLITRI